MNKVTSALCDREIVITPACQVSARGRAALTCVPRPARPAHGGAREGQKSDPASLGASFKLGPAESQRESLTLAGPAHGFESAELGVPSEVSAGHELIQPPKAPSEWGPSAMASCLGTVSDPVPLRARSRNLPTPIPGHNYLVQLSNFSCKPWRVYPVTCPSRRHFTKSTQD